MLITALAPRFPCILWIAWLDVLCVCLLQKEKLRKALVVFYQKYKPEKIPLVDAIVDKYVIHSVGVHSINATVEQSLTDLLGYSTFLCRYVDNQATLFEQLQQLYDDIPRVDGSRRLFVGQLVHDATKDDLQHYFERFGAIVDATVVRRKG